MKAKPTSYNRLLVFASFYLAMACQSYLFAQEELALEKFVVAATINIYENPDVAIKIGDSVFNLAKEDRTKIKALNLISDAYSSKRNYQKALEYFIKANQLSKNVNDPVLQIRITTKIAILYQQLKIYDKTIYYLDEAEKLMSNYPNQDSIMPFLSNNYIVRGLIYKEKLNCEIANGFFDKGISYLKQNDTKLAQANLSITYYNKGNCYIELQDNSSAKESFELAIEYAQLVNASSLQAFALKGLAEVYSNENENLYAITTLDKALELSKDVGDLILNQAIYKGLFENHLAMGNWEKYQEYQAHYLQTILSIKQSERGSVSNSLDEAEKEKEQELKKIQAQLDFSIFSLITFGLVAILLFIINERRIKKSTKKLLSRIKTLQ